MKKNVLVIFGGRSSEHEVSNMSVMTIINNIDINLYNIILVGITKKGEWKLVDNKKKIEDGTWINENNNAYLLPDCIKKSLLVIRDEQYEYIKVDIAFPVLHGLNGEDGSIQGLFQLADIDYVGCGILSSAIGMDKVYTKKIVKELDIKIADYIYIQASNISDIDVNILDEQIKKTFKYPVFVKPSNAGSSCGVSKAKNKDELYNAINIALKHDRKVLIEEGIIGQELECAVYGYSYTSYKDIVASPIGEIYTNEDFYDYDTKYINNTSKQIIDTDSVATDIKDTIKEYAKKIFFALDGFGLARVDFFYSEQHGIVFNEINTLPGFTNISMYPMLMEKYGLSNKELINGLIYMSNKRLR